MGAVSALRTQLEALHAHSVAVEWRVASGAHDEPPVSFAEIPPPLVGGTSIGKPECNHGADGYECGISLRSAHSLQSLQSLLTLRSKFSLQPLLTLRPAFSLRSLLTLRPALSRQALFALRPAQFALPLRFAKLLFGQSPQGTNQAAVGGPVPDPCQKHQGNGCQ